MHNCLCVLQSVFHVAWRPPGTSVYFVASMEAVSSWVILYWIGVVVFVGFVVQSLFIAIVRARGCGTPPRAPGDAHAVHAGARDVRGVAGAQGAGDE